MLPVMVLDSQCRIQTFDVLSGTMQYVLSIVFGEGSEHWRGPTNRGVRSRYPATLATTLSFIIGIVFRVMSPNFGRRRTIVLVAHASGNVEATLTARAFRVYVAVLILHHFMCKCGSATRTAPGWERHSGSKWRSGFSLRCFRLSIAGPIARVAEVLLLL